MGFWNRMRWGGVVCLVALAAVVLVLHLPAEAAKKKVPGTKLIKAKAKLGAPLEVNATEAAAASAARASEGFAPLAPKEKPFLPTMGQAAYQQAKAAAAAPAPAGKPAPGLAPGLAPDMVPATAPSLTAVNFAGDYNTGWYPPDTHGAAGHDYYCQIVNSRFSVYDKTGALLLRVGLDALTGYNTQGLVDPQVLYDPVFRRWIISVMALPEGVATGPQFYFMLVSQTQDPQGAWWVYRIDTRGLAGGQFFDYPHIGQDSRAVIVTANNFNYATTAWLDSRFFAWPKAWLYNGLPFNYIYTYNWTYGTIMPPVVLDNNRYSYLVSTNKTGADNIIKVIAFHTPATPIESGWANVYNVSVQAYSLPPSAAQPFTTSLLDTLDSRFVNASTQVGTAPSGAASLFQTHTVAYDATYPAPRYYEFILTPNSGSVRQWDWFWARASSYDWNASIVANRNKDVFVTWSSTDPSKEIFPQVRFGGRRSFADLGTGNFPSTPGLAVSGQAAATSVDHYDGFRWGDYSSVTIDPAVASGLTAWITNEWAHDNIDPWVSWRSQIAAITYLPLP